jgi:SUMO ligase MMS21 Smc5/6 complex component
MKAADRLFNYISITKTLGLTLGSNYIDWELHALVDASYNSYSDYKSHTGISLHLGSDSGAFLVLSKKQSVTVDSSIVVETPLPETFMDEEPTHRTRMPAKHIPASG